MAGFRKGEKTMIRIENILVPVDFSEPSQMAVNYGISLAHEFDAGVVLAHIAPFDRKLYETAKVRVLELIPPELRESLYFETIVKGGDVQDEILGIVAERDIDLVVMGTHGRGFLERMVLGSVTESMLRKLPVPVLTVSHLDPERKIGKPGVVTLKRILYASDLSDESEAGLKFSMRLARGLDARLTVAHVIDPLGAGFLGEQTAAYLPDYAGSIRAQAEEYLDRLVALESDGSVPVSTVLGEGIPWAVIDEIARDCKADLIVINLQGKGKLERALLGSTAEHVIRTAGVPVLSLPLPVKYASRWLAA
jgi:nucleotide-binding universal stress UspA family protein